jgi:hypothetical protein
MLQRAVTVKPVTDPLDALLSVILSAAKDQREAISS